MYLCTGSIAQCTGSQTDPWPASAAQLNATYFVCSILLVSPYLLDPQPFNSICYLQSLQHYLGTVGTFLMCESFVNNATYLSKYVQVLVQSHIYQVAEVITCMCWQDNA